MEDDRIFEKKNGCLRIYLPAEVDHHNSEYIRIEADQMIQRERIRCIQFDFEKTVFMDSSGIGMIIGRYKMIRFMGGIVQAIHVHEPVKKILRMAGMNRIIDVYDDMPMQYE